MILKGNDIVSKDSYYIYSYVQKSVTIKEAPASIILYAYNGVFTVNLPKACNSAGKFVYVRTEMATATDYATVTAASGDRIMNGKTVVTSMKLDDYGEDLLIFSDGLFWYVC